MGVLLECRWERHGAPHIRVEVDAVSIKRRDQSARKPMEEMMMRSWSQIAEGMCGVLPGFVLRWPRYCIGRGIE